MANETLWSLGVTTINQCYSYRSLDSVAALNIESTIWNLMGVAFIAMGEAVGIVMGHKLGSGELSTAHENATKMRRFTVLCGIVFGVLMIVVSPFFPLLYNTTDYIRNMASGFIMICGFTMPLIAFNHASYFIIRAGGNTIITVLFDSLYTWCIAVVAAFFMSHYTTLNVTLMFGIVQSLELLKCFVAFFMVRSNIWVKNIVK